MSLSEKDRAIIAATLPGNTSLTHFTDFRSSHEDLARLLAAVRQDAYKEGWNDREGDLIAGVNRVLPEEASGAGEPVAWINDLQFSRLRIAPKEASRVWGLPNGSINIPLFTSPPDTQARIEALTKAVEGIADDYMTSETHHPGCVLIPVAKFEQLRRATLEGEQS